MAQVLTSHGRESDSYSRRDRELPFQQVSWATLSVLQRPPWLVGPVVVQSSAKGRRRHSLP